MVTRINNRRDPKYVTQNINAERIKASSYIKKRDESVPTIVYGDIVESQPDTASSTPKPVVGEVISGTPMELESFLQDEKIEASNSQGKEETQEEETQVFTAHDHPLVGASDHVIPVIESEEGLSDMKATTDEVVQAESLLASTDEIAHTQDISAAEMPIEAAPIEPTSVQEEQYRPKKPVRKKWLFWD